MFFRVSKKIGSFGHTLNLRSPLLGAELLYTNLTNCFASAWILVTTTDSTAVKDKISMIGLRLDVSNCFVVAPSSNTNGLPERCDEL